MAGFLFKKKTKEKLAVIFDIGSASVGAALVGFKPGMPPRVFYTMRRDIPLSQTSDTVRLTDSMLKTLSSVAHDMVHEGFLHVRFTLLSSTKPELIFYVLASPWHVSQVRVIHLREEQPFHVDRDLIRKLVSREINDFKKMQSAGAMAPVIDNDNAPPANSGESHVIIEGDISDILLNRYHVRDPLGKNARELEMTLFVSSMPRALAYAIENVGSREFAEVESRLSSFTFAFFNAVRDIWHDKKDFLLIDMSGEVTDISIVKDGYIRDTTSFPIGRNTILRSFSVEHFSVYEAESLLALYYQNNLAADKAARVRDVLRLSQERWMQAFAKGLEQIAPQVLFPSDIFLTVDAPFEIWFKNMFENEAAKRILYDISSASRPFNILVLDGHSLAQYCRFSRSGIVKDPFLIIESLFLNKIFSVV